MHTSTSPENTDRKNGSLSPPENLALSSDDNGSVTSLDTNSNDRLQITVHPTQNPGSWLINVDVTASDADAVKVASITAYVIKREEVPANGYLAQRFRRALEGENKYLEVMLDFPEIFNADGTAKNQYIATLRKFFTPEDRQKFYQSLSVVDQPLNRAWILLIRDIEVNERYRRLGIGGNMVRKLIQVGLEMCKRRGRPLLVAVQPKSHNELPDTEMYSISKLSKKRRVNEVFWERIGFSRLAREDVGFLGPWHFWGTPRGLPSKKRIVIPADDENRETRLSTPPARDPPRRRIKVAVEPVHPDARGDNGQRDEDGISWFDDPADPSLSSATRAFVAAEVARYEAEGEPYRLRPMKRAKNPFKARGERVPLPLFGSKGVSTARGGKVSLPVLAPKDVSASRSGVHDDEFEQYHSGADDAVGYVPPFPCPVIFFGLFPAMPHFQMIGNQEGHLNFGRACGYDRGWASPMEGYPQGAVAKYGTACEAETISLEHAVVEVVSISFLLLCRLWLWVLPGVL